MHCAQLLQLTMAEEVAAAKAQACEAIIGYVFQDKQKIREALQLADSEKQPKNEGNTRIAVIGDRVLDLILAEEWHARGDRRASWGEISSSVCSNAYLARVCRHHELQELVTSGTRGAKLSNWTLATIIEAILGAVYQDGGIAAARIVMTSLGIFGHETDIMATTSLRGSSPELMVLSTKNNLNIWTPCRATE